jgi:transcriptional regulator with XRE-family HTH domain
MSRKKLPVEQNSLGARIEARLVLLNMSRVDLARATGFKTSYLSQVIRGLKYPSEKFYALVAQNLHVVSHWLRTGEGDMTLALPIVSSDPKVNETNQTYTTPRGSIGTLIKKAVEILESDDAILVAALSQNIEAFHRSLIDHQQAIGPPEEKAPARGLSAKGGAGKEM